MQLRRFYAPPRAFAIEDKTVTLDPDEARHLREVLRLRAGAQVAVFDGTGREFLCEIADLDKRVTKLALIEEIAPRTPESPLDLTLAISLLKGEKLELVVQKATELGATCIALVETKNSDVRLKAERGPERRLSRLKRIMLDAAKQSGRAFIPSISEPVGFEDFISARPEQGLRLLFAERAGQSLNSLVNANAQPFKLTALVGPEGGWTSEELSLAGESGWQIVTLGGRILRAETAAIVTTALLQHTFGDLS
jgi:16S rRNA (uracil1498-N3)-methyltransferase